MAYLFQHCFSLFMFKGICLFTALLGSCHSISIELKSGLWLFHSNSLFFFFFSHSYVKLLLCLGSLSCCMIHFQPRLSCWTDGLTLVSIIFWYKVEFIIFSMTTSFVAAQIITPPPAYMMVGMKCSCWYTVFGFCQASPPRSHLSKG